MKLKDIKDVLTFAAFRPEPDDSVDYRYIVMPMHL